MKTRPNKILNRLPSPGARLALAALLAAPLLFSGCNAGTAVLTYLLQDSLSANSKTLMFARRLTNCRTPTILECNF